MSGGALLRVVLGASLAASLAGAWMVAARHVGAPPAAPDRGRLDDARRSARADVPALVGDVQLPGGLRLAARIVRLHAPAGEQRFDARALQQRLRLPAGEPFVCELRLSAALAEPMIPADSSRSSDASGASGATARSSHGAASVGAAFDLVLLRVVDEQGAALVPFANADAKNGAAPADPLATLLAPPVEPLRAGEAISIALWGREPLARARVVGLADVRGRAREDPPEIVLTGASLAQSEVDTALARVGASARPAKDEGR